MAGPGPAIGGEIDEKPVITQHSINVDGKTLHYTATAAQMPLKDASGQIIGMVALMRDVTRRFEEIRALKRKLADAAKSAR